MKAETRTCQNCKQEFTIEPEDFAFYDKIKVPPPTWCPECRVARRAVFRNERNFYRRQCRLCKKNMISIYPESATFPVYCQECYWSDKWDPASYGRDYDFSKPFFIQWKALSAVVPRVALINRDSIDTFYSHLSTNNKNCYLLIESSYNENVHHGYWMQRCKDCLDGAYDTNAEKCVETLAAFDSHKIFYSLQSFNCSDSWFLRSCRNCHYCFGCINLRHKSYCFFNEQLTKEEYEKRIAGMRLDTYTGIINAQNEVQMFYLQQPWCYRAVNNVGDSTGNYLTNSNHCYSCFFAYGAEDAKYAVHILNNVRDVYDVDTAGVNAELLYEDLNTALSVSRVAFTNRCWTGHEVYYSEHIDNCNYAFGCISLRQKSYSIFNKQYTEEEYKKLIPKIIQHMNDVPYTDASGRIYRYGEFFPPEFSPFAYNETIAQSYYPLTKEEIQEKGFTWKEHAEKKYPVSLLAEKLPDAVTDIPADITKEIIGCMHKGVCAHQCTSAFKVTPAEVGFYRALQLPLPRLCPNCRHEERTKWLNPFRLWHRKCMCGGVRSENGVYSNKIEHFHKEGHCPHEFETTFALGRPEIIYCEECYNIEVA